MINTCSIVGEISLNAKGWTWRPTDQKNVHLIKFLFGQFFSQAKVQIPPIIYFISPSVIQLFIDTGNSNIRLNNFLFPSYQSKQQQQKTKNYLNMPNASSVLLIGFYIAEQT